MAGPLAASAVGSVGHAVANAAEPFTAALGRALGGESSAVESSAREVDSPETSQARLQRRLAELLAPFAGAGGPLAFRVDLARGDVEVGGDSPAADAVRRALAEDGQLRDDFLQIAKDASGVAHEADAWPRFFAGDAGDAAVRITWDGAGLTVA